MTVAAKEIFVAGGLLPSTKLHHCFRRVPDQRSCSYYSRFPSWWSGRPLCQVNDPFSIQQLVSL